VKKTFKNLSDLVGEGVEVKENPKMLKKKEEKSFVNLISNLCQIEAHTALMDAMGVNIDGFQETHLKVFDTLLRQCYGDIKTSIIMWWVFESINGDGEVSGIIDENNKEHIINTPSQLYKFLKKYNEQ
jgi:hypothetical protein